MTDPKNPNQNPAAPVPVEGRSDAPPDIITWTILGTIETAKKVVKYTGDKAVEFAGNAKEAVKDVAIVKTGEVLTAAAPKVEKFLAARIAPNNPQAQETVRKSVESGFQGAFNRLYDENSHVIFGDNKSGIKEDPQYPNVFYRHSHEKVGPDSPYSISFLVRAPNLKDAQDPFGHEYVILNHPDANGKPTQTILSYVAESFDKGKISKAWSVLAHGAPDNHVNGKLATHRDAKGNIVNPQDAADQVITVNLQDGNGMTASQKMDKLVGLANDIEKKSYELYDYNCDASVLEMLKGVSVLSPNIAAEANTKVNAARNGQFHMLLDGNALQKTGNSINPNYTDLPKDFTVNVPPASVQRMPARALPHLAQ